MLKEAVKVPLCRQMGYTLIAGVPGEKPSVTSDKLPDFPSKFPYIQL